MINSTLAINSGPPKISLFLFPWNKYSYPLVRAFYMVIDSPIVRIETTVWLGKNMKGSCWTWLEI